MTCNLCHRVIGPMETVHYGYAGPGYVCTTCLPLPPSALLKNQVLSDEIMLVTAKQCAWLDLISPPGPPPTAWQRWRYRITSFVDRWTPRVHLGPCPEGEEY